MRVLCDFKQNPRYRDEMEAILQTSYSSLAHTWIASVDEDGNMLAGMIYSHFQEKSCNMSVVVKDPRGVQRHVLEKIFAYPFLQCGLRRVTGVIRESNQRSLNFALALGYTVEAKLKHWYADEDGVQVVMLREDCKWLR